MERKVVFQEDQSKPPIAIVGVVEDAGDFLKVRNHRGEITIAKRIVLTIKNASGGGVE